MAPLLIVVPEVTSPEYPSARKVTLVLETIAVTWPVMGPGLANADPAPWPTMSTCPTTMKAVLSTETVTVLLVTGTEKLAVVVAYALTPLLPSTPEDPGKP
jgi:hypothetical protein